MKKIALSFCIVCMSVSAVVAQTVPDSVRKNFKTTNPDVKDVTWKTENNEFYATYQDTGKNDHIYIYGKDGKMIRQQSMISTKEVPNGISDYYKTNYPAEKNYKVWLEQDQAGMKKYYIPGKNGTLYFDQDGKYINKDNSGTGTKDPNGLNPKTTNKK